MLEEINSLKDQFYKIMKKPAVFFPMGCRTDKLASDSSTHPRNERKAATATQDPGSPPQVPRPCTPLQKTPIPKLIYLSFCYALIINLILRH